MLPLLNLTSMEDTHKLVYVVDDDEIFHFIIKKMMGQQFGQVSVTSFLSAEDALETLTAPAGEDTLPSLIILDMNMQRMSGWDFLDAYRDIKTNIPKQIPIVMCSSSIDMRDMQKVQTIPELTAYITKPLDKMKLKVLEDYLC